MFQGITCSNGKANGQIK
uniref:Uncharacterized protein n=1 Tax=Lepeophtheirus salmonis TaxID=72036 RepID=A0A0K2U621_LEPSM